MPQSRRSLKRRKKVKKNPNNGKARVKDVYQGFTINSEVKKALKIIEDPDADFDERMRLRDKYFNQNEVKSEYVTPKTKYSH